MGNTDPNNTKQENKYEVKPQYEELSKQKIMQHAIINAMKCMRAIKDRIASPVYQLENHHNQPLNPHDVSTREIIGTTHQSASHNVGFNQVINQSVNQAQDVYSQGTTQPIEASQPSPAMAITVDTPWNSNLNLVSNNQLNLNSTSKVLRSSSIIQLPNPTEYFSTLKRGLNLSRNHLHKSAQHPKNALPDFSRNIRTPAASRSIPQVVLQSLMGNNRKIKPQGVSPPPALPSRHPPVPAAVSATNQQPIPAAKDSKSVPSTKDTPSENDQADHSYGKNFALHDTVKSYDDLHTVHNLLNALTTDRGPRLLGGTSSSPTSTSPRRHLNKTRDSQGTTQPIEASQPSPAMAITVDTPWNSNLNLVSNNQLNLNSTSKVLRSSSIIQLPNPTEYFSTLKRGLNLSRNHLHKSAQHPKNALPDFSRNIRTPAASRSIPQVVLQSLMGNNRKIKPQGVQRHPNRQKQRLESTEI
ncbi:interactor of constitutive active ROPs 4-like [Dorcoceras hygrometricum]|uniref:Interactor of constitutive active ROPs 4-like n=1 Tax=Dorcoceras hygrometricum TaxID=472368 RepID=A0A2Z7BN96_9LAMI|nr:interactor of constitutive active ROPs 4-like [Dorcoceras hygrometricum]